VLAPRLIWKGLLDCRINAGPLSKCCWVIKNKILKIKQKIKKEQKKMIS
jgi:hypothetical protein